MDAEESITLETKAVTLRVGQDFDPSRWHWGKILKATHSEVRIQFAAKVDKPAESGVESPATTR